MITLTLGAIVDAQAALERVAGHPLPVKTAYRVARLVRLIRPEAAQFVEQRNSLVREYGAERPASPAERTVSGEASTIEVPPEQRPAFFAKVAELAAIEVRIDVDPIELDALDGMPISATDLLALDPFLLVR